MKRFACLPLFALVASCPAGRGAALSRLATPAAVAFVDVAVVDAAAGSVRPGQTVVVRGDRIESVGTAPAPPDALAIAGTGKFLVPGLIDMHVHVREKDLAAYVEAGVTSVRHMWGFPGLLELADRVVRDQELGPAIHAASPGVDGPGSPWPYTELIQDPAAADALIDRLAGEGWRWIKVYPHLEANVYAAVLAAAQREGIRVIGHVPFSVQIEDAMRDGHYSVEHLVGYERSLVPQSSGFYPDWAAADPESMRALAGLTASLGAWNCPTLTIIGIYAGRMANGALVVENRRRMVRALRDAGARLLAGTDAGIDVTQPGSSLHDELAELVGAGLTTAEALRAATTTAAEFLQREGEIGAIAEGARADLLLVDADPLLDLSALRSPPTLMLRGALYERR